MRKRDMGLCRVPCHLGGMDPDGAVVVSAGTAVGAGTEVAGAVPEEPEPDE